MIARVRIARVRIAPVEQWCEMARKSSKLQPGTTIAILTDSMFDYDPTVHTDGCGGKAWVVERTWAKKRHEELGIPECPISGVCEHMLEMD